MKQRTARTGALPPLLFWAGWAAMLLLMLAVSTAPGFGSSRPAPTNLLLRSPGRIRIPETLIAPFGPTSSAHGRGLLQAVDGFSPAARSPSDLRRSQRHRLLASLRAPPPSPDSTPTPPLPSLSHRGDAPLPLPAVVRSCTVPGVVALTFDDGVNHELTPKLLDTLDKFGAKATFFVVGHSTSCIYHPDTITVLQRMLRAGHQLGGHTWMHTNMNEAHSFADVEAAIEKLNSAMAHVVGVSSRFVRPPWGGLQNGHFNLTKLISPSYALALWDRETNDWEGNATATLERYDGWFGAMNASTDSLLVLGHDNQVTTVESVVPVILEAG